MVVLLAAVVVLAGAARVSGISDPIVLLLGGLALGFVPGAPSPELDPDVVFFVFLPPLLYSAAFLATGADLREHAPSLGILAIGLVLPTAGAVAVVAHVVAGLPWAVAFVLGAVVGPTDPVSATAVVRRVGAPRRIETLLEGEALINDGTGLTAYTVAVGVVGAGSLSLLAGAGRFVLVAAGGAAVGATIGWLASHARGRLVDANLDIAVALLTAYAAYVLADRLGTSGILATVAAGIVVQRRNGSHGSEQRARRALVAAQRDTLAELRRRGLPADTVRELRRELDLEESRFGGGWTLNRGPASGRGRPR